VSDARGPDCNPHISKRKLLVVRIFGFSEAGVAFAWSADILVRSVPGLKTEADKDVRAPRNRRCAPAGFLLTALAARS
jgi:hypothetical protein